MKYPDIEVQLTGRDSNAFAIIAAVSSALRDAGVESVVEIPVEKSLAYAG